MRKNSGPFFATFICLKWIASRAEKLVIAKNVVLVREDEEAKFVFIIKTGKVKFTKTASDGNECVVHLMGDGETFVELSQTEGPHYFLTATTLSQCFILKMNREDHVELLQMEPSLALWAIKDLSFWGRDMVMRIRDLGVGDVQIRFARLFFRLGDRVGVGSDFLELQIPRKEIAEIIHARPETVTRIISCWKKSGLIVPAPTGLRVNRAGLRKILQGKVTSTSFDPPIPNTSNF